MNPENLRYLLELSRTGRLADAAQRLDVDETTLSRRIGRLEEEIGQRIFSRGRGGWDLTEVGRQLLPFAEEIETTVSAAVELVTSKPGELAGTVRLVAPDGFGAYVLVPGLGDFREAHPSVYLEVATSTSRDFMTGRDFDVAVTLERPARGSAHVERLADYELGLYASPQYLSVHGTPVHLDEARNGHSIVWYLDALLDVQPLRILDQMLPGARARVQTNNITGHVTAALNGVGLAPLPTYIADNESGLVRVLTEEFSAERTYWLVVPSQYGRLARVSAMAEALRLMVAKRRGLRAARR